MIDFEDLNLKIFNLAILIFTIHEQFDLFLSLVEHEKSFITSGPGC